MPLFNFKCDGCDEIKEYETNKGMAGDKVPEDGKCVSCGGNLSKILDLKDGAGGFDLVGSGFYINDYGKKAWKRNLSAEEQSRVLTGERAPY